jgi:hypothetical protein
MSAFTSIYFKAGRRKIYDQVLKECERLDISANSIFNKFVEPLHDALKSIPSPDMSPIYITLKPIRIK